MQANQANTSFATQIREGANLVQQTFTNGVRQKIGAIGGKTFASFLAGENTTETPQKTAKSTPKTQTATKDFLKRQNLQQTLINNFQQQGINSQVSPTTSKNGIRVRSGKGQQKATGQLRHNFGMEDTRKTRLQSNPSAGLNSMELVQNAASTLAPQYSRTDSVSVPKLSTNVPGAINLDLAQNFLNAAPSNLGTLSKMLTNPKGQGKNTAFAKFVSKHAAILEQKFSQSALALRTSKHRPVSTDELVAKELDSLSLTITGALSARYESGSQGIAAIGYDQHGGTSYGKFQISSRAGTMNKFIEYLEEQAPDFAERLKKTGHSNTKSRTGKMPEEWKKIAAEYPEQFEQLQDEFIKTSHFTPAVKALEETKGVNFENMPLALQEVLFSTAVQHGAAGASRIVGRALDRLGSKLSALQQATEDSAGNILQEAKKLIEHIYDLRSNQFGSSTKRIQVAAKHRMQREKQEALQLLRA